MERRPGGATWADLQNLLSGARNQNAPDDTPPCDALIARMVAEARMFASSPSATAVAQPHAGTPPTS